MLIRDTFRQCYDTTLTDPDEADKQYSHLGDRAPMPLSERVMKPLRLRQRGGLLSKICNLDWWRSLVSTSVYRVSSVKWLRHRAG